MDDQLRSLGVVVVNYGSHEIVESNLTRSLGRRFPGHVVIVDNLSSADERAEIIEVGRRHRWKVLTPPANEGFGGGCNLGAAQAINLGATELLFLNPDAWINLESIRGLQTMVRADPQVLLSPEVRRPDGRVYSAEFDLHLDIGEMRSARRRPEGMSPARLHTWVSGACFMVGVRLWEKVGGFDEDYFLYWEDADLSRRVVKIGGTVRAEPSLVAVHDEGSTHRGGIPPRAKSPLYYYYNTRNRLLYAAKHLSAEEGRRWVRATPRASYRILLQGGRRQFVHPGRTFLPAFRGSWDGIRLWRKHRRTAEHGVE